jgi:alpha-tubulin suppressor-like RCC1 family protein
MLKRLLSVLVAHVVADPVAMPTLATGRGFSFVVEDHVAKAVGNNRYGQLGVGGSSETRKLTDVRLDGEVKMVAAGAFHSLFMMTNGLVFASGRNNHGQLANVEYDTRLHFPEQVTFADNESFVTAVAAGYAHSLFLTSDGIVYAAGYNSVGQLGDGTTVSRSEAVPVQGLNGKVAAIAAGYDFSYFLMESGEVFATGQNLGGQLGDASRQSKSLPVKVEIDDVTAIAAGHSHGLFLRRGKVHGTGANYLGQLGEGTYVLQSFPQNTALTVNSVGQIFAGGDSSCAIEENNGIALVFGSNIDGQIGRGDEYRVRTPYSVKAEVLVSSVGESHALLLQDQGTLWASGSNAFGQLVEEDGDDDWMGLTVRVFVVTAGVKVPPAPAPAPTPQSTKGPNSPNSSSDDNTWIVLAVSAALLVGGLLIFCRAAATEAAPQVGTEQGTELAIPPVKPELSA